MNTILNSPLPDCISVNGVTFPVKTDYRVWLQVGELLQEYADDGDGGTREQAFELASQIHELIRDGKADGTIEGGDFLTAVIRFYGGYDDGIDRPKGAQRPAYDFTYDAPTVYQSFASMYGIRLALTDMHWWEFLTLFQGLMMAEGNPLSYVVGLRRKDLSKIPKEQRSAYARAKSAVALPKPAKQRELENKARAYLLSLWEEPNEHHAE